MKKFICILAILALIHPKLFANGFEVIDGLKYLIVTETKEATLVQNDYTGNIVVPDTVIASDSLEYTVIAFAEECFKNCSSLTSV
ncbi:MAG: hypothetical protein Q4D41_08400, partial [Prevotellaceae bacterium]|nr:hypothetical protein [Prevotellaceae bacterium]